ncbi:LamG domain-containing protein [Myceligenerans cantabricum]
MLVSLALVAGLASAPAAAAELPAPPTISSPTWPESDPADPEDPWLDGVGVEGRFTFSSTDPDVVSYHYGVNGPPSAENEAVSGFWFVPQEPGVHTISARALNDSGDKSSTATYQIRIGSGRAAVSDWTFGEDSTPYQLEGDAQAVSLPAGEGPSGAALALDGYGDGATSQASVDTEASFAVEAWARLDSLPEGQGVVVSQGSSDRLAFKLYYERTADGGQWAFARYDEESDGDGYRAVVHPSAEPEVGRWTHLVGVYDQLESSLRIYVDGIPGGEVAMQDPVGAEGTVYLGHDPSGHCPSAFVHGQIDGVRLYDRQLTSSEVDQHVSDSPELRQAVASRWSFEGTAPGAASVTNEVSGAPDLVLGGDAVPAEEWWIGMQALDLGTAGGYGSSSPAPIDMSENFTVATFARAAGDVNVPATLLSLTGADASALALRYVPDPMTPEGQAAGAWELRLRTPDGSVRTASADAGFVGAWTHLAISYDYRTRTARLYVDGVNDAGTGVVEDVRLAADVQTFDLGRGKFAGAWAEPWHGLADDVWLFEGTLSGSQVASLASGSDLPTQVPGSP